MAEKNKTAFGVEPANRRYRLRLARYQALAETVRDFVQKRRAEGANTLDLVDTGVGSGRTMRFIEGTGVADSIRFFALDISSERLGRVYSREKWRMAQANGNVPLPFKDESFDIVISEQLVEHLENPAAAVKEMGRILRPGGLLILGVPIFPPGIPPIRRVLVELRMRLFGIVEGHIQSFTAHSIRQFVKQSGHFDTMTSRGMRMMSGGLIGFLEDYRWWYRFNRFLGRIAPDFCTEVQIIATKRDRA